MSGQAQTRPRGYPDSAARPTERWSEKSPERSLQIPTVVFLEHIVSALTMSTENNDDGGDFGSLETYDPTDDVDLGDFGGGTDESPDVNDDGEIISDEGDEVRDFSGVDERDTSNDDPESTTETRKTTLDQQGLDGENIFAGSDGDNTDSEGIETYDPTEEFENPHSFENADKDTPPTWETVQKSPSRIRWQCDTGEHVAVLKNDAGEFDVQRENTRREKHDDIASGVSGRETAIEIAYSYMESNACLSEEEIFGDEALREHDEGASSIAQESQVDAFEVEQHDADDPESTDEEERIMQREASEVDADGAAAQESGEGEGGGEGRRGGGKRGEDKEGDEDGCQDPVEVEFGSRDVANSVRDQNEDHLCPLDDRRKKTVAFVRDTPEEVLDEARSAAAETRADKNVDSHGQVELTEREKNQIDFSDVNIFHARTVKGIALDHGVKNWLDFYDPTLQADEHIGIMEDAEAASRLDADELDSETVDEKISETQSVVDSEECDHAERGCEDGFEEACEFLEEECDVPQSRIDELLDEDDFGDGVRDPDDPDLDADNLPLEVRVALKKAWTGYRAGRADAKGGGSAAEARAYAGIINSIRRAVGQEMIEFESAGSFEGGVVEPSEVGAEFEPRFEVYDPTEEFAD